MYNDFVLLPLQVPTPRSAAPMVPTLTYNAPTNSQYGFIMYNDFVLLPLQVPTPRSAAPTYGARVNSH